MTILDEAQNRAFDNYHAASSVAAETGTNSTLSQNYDNDNGDPTLDTSHGSENMSETDFQGSDLHTGHESLQSAFYASENNNFTLCPGCRLGETEGKEKTAVDGTADSVFHKTSNFEATEQDVPSQQQDRGDLNYPYDHWPSSSGSERMDLDSLLFGTSWQMGTSADVRT
jgi:hypothetical protein